eukprot:TRINITY_DN12171_c1_g2_i1.p3 TRINITY_DN12171_c1_g2~~TRINITY_DN12171_c1_g2_i1.p3  ORF type:complete len:147 (-),score=14.56 TRINITY_DN12171_c1_g2_i1:671-1111(-)
MKPKFSPQQKRPSLLRLPNRFSPWSQQRYIGAGKAIPPQIFEKFQEMFPPFREKFLGNVRPIDKIYPTNTKRHNRQYPQQYKLTSQVNNNNKNISNEGILILVPKLNIRQDGCQGKKMTVFAIILKPKMQQPFFMKLIWLKHKNIL